MSDAASDKIKQMESVPRAISEARKKRRKWREQEALYRSAYLRPSRNPLTIMLEVSEALKLMALEV